MVSHYAFYTVYSVHSSLWRTQIDTDLALLLLFFFVLWLLRVQSCLVWVVATVRIAQINLQHKRTATINLCRLIQNGTAQVTLVQEPYFRKGNFYLGNLVNPVFATFSKNEMANSRVMPRACVLVNNAIVATLISELTTRDVCAITIDVSVGNLNRKYVYCSVYLPHNEPSPTDAFKQVIAYCTSKGLPLIVGSDANAHHIIWGSSDINLRGFSLMEYLSSTDLGLLNIGNRPTFMVSGREEVLDITQSTSHRIGCCIRW